MTDDPMRPSGGELPQGRQPTGRTTRPASAARPHGAGAASKFVGRVSQLDADAVRAVVENWRDIMRRSSEEWFAAEEAAANAVGPAGVIAEQEILLGHLAESVLRGVWYRGGTREPSETLERHVRATEASAQYVASVAMVALLVGDRLPADQFTVLYRPFARLIALEDLGRE